MQNPNDLFKAAIEACQGGDWEKGIRLLDTLAEACPDDPTILTNLGAAYGQTKRHGTAIAILSYASALDPESANTWSNLAACFVGGMHPEYKQRALEKALKLDPKSPAALANMTGCYTQTGNPNPGIAYGLRAIEAAPENGIAHANLALCLMEAGRWQEAWPHWQQHRWAPTGGYQRKYPAPFWDGSEVDSLIVHGEQGLGDEVMFLGCLDFVLPRVRKRLMIEVNPKLVRLVRCSFIDPRVEVIGAESEFTGSADAVVALGDLVPLVCEGVPPRRSWYLTTDVSRVSWWRARLEKMGPRPWVALALHGGAKHTHEAVRNPPREVWRPVIEAAGTAFSIQYGGERGAKIAEEVGVPHLALAAEDIDEQAACIAAADVLVSVPQTALHLGGAMGQRVIGVISDKPAWRYGIAGEMPWYRTVDLVRQARGEAWSVVMERVAQAVRA